jgi:hypothetical protein
MVELDFEAKLREINRLIGAGASEDVVLVQARELKRAMSAHVQRMGLLINTLDHLVASFAPSPTWYWGWLPADQLATASGARTIPKYDRTSRVAEVAAALSEGGRRVRAADVIERLRLEGEQLPDKPLSTAIGNILHRTGRWNRVRKGEYQLISDAN